MSLLSYLDLKQEVWDILQTKIDAGDLKSLSGAKPTLYWGRREPEGLPDAICPEIQLISDNQSGGKAITDQEPFYFPRSNYIILRVLDKSAIKKTAETSSISLAQEVMVILKDQGVMSDKVVDPGIETVRFDEVEGERGFFFSSDIIYQAESND